MSSSLFALPLVVLGGVLLAAGCTVTADPGPDPGVDAFVCVDDGATCDVDDDCCSNVCAAGVCATPVDSCLEDNSACTDAAECCSGVCASDGYCGYPATVVEVTCSADDVACTDASECCSNLCAVDGFCGAPADSCTLDNGPCNGDAECCSNVCASDGFCGLP